jgi:hypothetical protein
MTAPNSYKYIPLRELRNKVPPVDVSMNSFTMPSMDRYIVHSSWSASYTNLEQPPLSLSQFTAQDITEEADTFMYVV